MNRLDFHSRVLGEKASKRLINLSGGFLTFRSRQFKISEVEIYLDDKLLGIARIGLMFKKVNLGSLTTERAILGGFDTVEEQQHALRLAGYRFKPLDEYEAYPIHFIGDWGKEKE